MNNLFHFLILNYFNWNFFYDFNWDNLWNFNDSINNFFNDFLNFNDFGNTSEDLENVIDVNNIHYLLSDHTNDAFINFQSGSSPCF